MDSTNLFNNIKELGHINSKRDELREYCKIKIDQVSSHKKSSVVIKV